MSAASKRARKAIDRAIKALDEQRLELQAAKRELGEADDEEITLTDLTPEALKNAAMGKPRGR